MISRKKIIVSQKIGMMRHFDGSLHYTINGEDQGVACENIPANVYAVIDLYGQCAQVSVVHHLGLGSGGPTANLVQSHHRLIHENNSMASSQVKICEILNLNEYLFVI